MRIIYLHQYFTTPTMSGGTRSFEMARRLARDGHEVHMITSWRGNGHTKPFTSLESGIHVHWLPIPYDNSMGFWARIAAFLRFALTSCCWAVRIPCDVVLATSTPLTICIPGALASRWHGVPLIFEVRDLWPEAPIALGAIQNPVVIAAAQWLERYAYRKSSRIIALSAAMAQGVRKCGFPGRRISVIPNSSDNDFFDSPECDAELFLRDKPELRGARIVLYAGTLGRVNGVEYLVDMALSAASCDPTIRFVVVGAGGQEDLVRRKAASAGVLGRSMFMYPAVAKRDIRHAYAAAHLTLSLFVNNKVMWANSANKFFDSLAAGRPIAINHGGWQADLIKKHSLGLVLPADDPSSAGLAVVAVVQDMARLHTMGQAARQVALTQFDRETLYQKFRNVLLAASS